MRSRWNSSASRSAAARSVLGQRVAMRDSAALKSARIDQLDTVCDALLAHAMSVAATPRAHRQRQRRQAHARPEQPSGWKSLMRTVHAVAYAGLKGRVTAV